MALSGKVRHYEIGDLLGSGAMGEVYRATDTKMFDRPVAVKILSERLSKNDQARTRFQREVEVAARLGHPNIVTIHDWGEHEGRPYFVMEFIDGTSLAEIIRGSESPTFEHQVEIGRQICDALEFAHGQSVIHRDVKPGNIMVTRLSGQERIKLVDFGIVHVERSDLTTDRSQPGTFSYMSPEQINNVPLDHRSDLFSLGIVLYELFTSAHPFDAPSDMLIPSKIVRDEPEPPRKLKPEMPAALESLILKLLEKDPVQRPQTAGEVAEALRQILRRYQSRGAVTDPSEYEHVDDLTRQMVENLVAWARQKEADGALEEALEAYEKASHLAPDSERLKRKLPKLRHRIESDKKLRELLGRARDALEQGKFVEAREHWRNAWILSPDDPAVGAIEEEIQEAESRAPDDHVRAEFVQERVKLAEGALDEGEVDRARPPLVEILKRYPDEALAAVMLDRLIQIKTSGVPYKDYRAEFKRAKQALDAGEFAEAREACSRALELWPGDEETLALERDMASRVEAEVTRWVGEARGKIRAAEELSHEEARALAIAAEARECLRRAREIGGDETLVEGSLREVDELEEDLKKRVEGLERLQREREERRQKVVATFLQRGRNLLDEAQRFHERGPDEHERALEAYRQSREAFERVLEEDAANDEARSAGEKIRQAVQELEKEIEERGRRAAEVALRIAEARRVLEEVEPLSRGEETDLRRCLERLGNGRLELDWVLENEPSEEEARALDQEYRALVEFVESDLARREKKRREREAAIAEGLARGRDRIAEARRLAAGDLDDLRSAEEICRTAERDFRGVLTLEREHVAAREAKNEIATLLEHVRSEIRRQKEEKERAEQEREEIERRRAEEEAAARAVAEPPDVETEQEPEEPEVAATEAREETVEVDERTRQQEELQSVRERIARCRRLGESGRTKEALDGIADLDRECRAREWLHEAMPEIEALTAELRSSGRPAWLPWAGGAAAALVVIVLGVWGIAALVGGNGEGRPADDSVEAAPESAETGVVPEGEETEEPAGSDGAKETVAETLEREAGPRGREAATPGAPEPERGRSRETEERRVTSPVRPSEPETRRETPPAANVKAETPPPTPSDPEAAVTRPGLKEPVEREELGESQSGFYGRVCHPRNGAPMAGYVVSFRNLRTGQVFESEPSGPDGSYSVAVPLGPYTIVEISGPGGKKQEIADRMQQWRLIHKRPTEFQPFECAE